jgi:hypothetical protein
MDPNKLCAEWKGTPPAPRADVEVDRHVDPRMLFLGLFPRRRAEPQEVEDYWF